MYETVEDTFKYLPEMPEGSLAEFGVHLGNTMNRLIKGAEDCGRPFPDIIGFDSWVGIPAETEGIPHNPDWPVSAFSICHDWGLATPEEAEQFIRDKITRKDVVLISGFFDKTLTYELGAMLSNSAAYCHIDVDIHKSTKQVLDWVTKYRVLKTGCIIRFDDWVATGYNGVEWSFGNSLALKQCLEETNIKLERLSTNVFRFIKYD